MFREKGMLGSSSSLHSLTAGERASTTEHKQPWQSDICLSVCPSVCLCEDAAKQISFMGASGEL